MKWKRIMMIFAGCASFLGINAGCNAPGDTPPAGKVFSETAEIPGKLQWQQGILTNDSNRYQTVTAAAKMKENSRLTLPVKLPAKGAVQIRTTRGEERFIISRQNDHLVWAFYDLNGKMVKPADHWWENNCYYPNGFFQDNFALSKEFRDRVNHIKSRFYRDISQTFFPVALEVRQQKLRLFFDHILIAEMPWTNDLALKSPQIILPPEAAVGSGTVEKLPELDRNFYTVNLTNKFNAATQCNGLHAEKRSLIFQGIPFEISPASAQGFTALDLGQVWFAEGGLSAYAPPNSGTFGGRWSGALGGNRSRMQFRIPNRHYTAIYLLASCEERADRIAEVSAQFFRNHSGFPKNFTAEKVEISGKNLQLIKIPVEPGELIEFKDRNTLELELTGRTHIFRAWPDPNHFSIHGAGTPSGVQIYAMTLETAPVSVDFVPESEGNVWVESAPAYMVTLTNNTAEKISLPLEITTVSFDGEEVVKDIQQTDIPPWGKAVTRFDLPLKKYGWHQVTLVCGGKKYIHFLTRLRRREIKGRPFAARGFMFGYWDWDGAHLTADNAMMHRLFGMAGLESFARSNGNILDRTVFPSARKWGFKYFASHYRGIEREPESFEAMQKYLKEREVHRASHRISSQSPADFFEPVYTHVFAEPGGIGTHGTLPEFYGEPVKKLTADEQKVFLAFKKKVLDAHKIFRSEYPGTKILLPWGDPVFTVPFLQDEESRYCFDGVAYDTGYFMRLPEQQLHQCSIHRMMQFWHYWKKFRRDKPLLVSVEGPCIARVAPGSLDQRSNAAHTIRCALLLGAYGINRQFAIAGTTSCASYWGEQHYGGGAFTRLYDVNPYAVYAAIATMTRHLRYMEFVRWVPTGSLSVYALEFKDSRNGKLLHVLWTIRGRRPVKMKFQQIYDLMDNQTDEAVISDLPIFVYGCDGKFELGAPDHSDVQLAPAHIRLGNAAELFPIQTQDADDEYVNSFPDAVRRFPAEMEIKKVPGGLSIHLPEQKTERLTMPYYTALKPEKPVIIPGKAKYITVETTAGSDWGRIVYVLRDAKGEKFISVGQKNSWNSDDQPNASFFNFDGKRLLRFELPSSLTYDGFREAGSAWWGVSGGDGVVDYPLAIEKIFVERRRHAMYVNSLEPTDRKAVILGDWFVEYENEAMKNFVPQVKMPPVKSSGKEYNIIRELDKNGQLPPSRITGVEPPDHYYDGTRGVFHFDMVKDAAYYEIYLSLNEDGSQAIKRGVKLKKSGVLVNGFLADTDFYAFVVYYTKDGRQSKVSAPFKFKLKDNFSNK